MQSHSFQMRVSLCKLIQMTLMRTWAPAGAEEPFHRSDR